MLLSMTMNWGDLALEEEQEELFRKRIAAAQAEADAAQAEADEFNMRDDEYSTTKDALAGWEVPDLSLRKGIWENFPVTLTPIVTHDGVDRYAVRWHERNLVAWRADCCSYDEGANYQEYCEIRLNYALERFAHKYAVEPARDGSLMTLRMVFKPKEVVAEGTAEVAADPCAAPHAPVVAVAATPAAATTGAVPRRKVLATLLSFPLSWVQEGKFFKLEIHKKRLSESGRTWNDVEFDLLAALQECACTVSPGRGKFVMFVTEN
jgi:hypothetical protein